MTDEEIHEQLDGLIADWHEGSGRGKTLAEFLGMTPEQYGPFASRAILPEGYAPPIRPVPTSHAHDKDQR